MAQVVYTGLTDGEGIEGNLFQGTKFWLSQKVPQRKRFIEQVKANGGEITPLEKEANVKIVDHARKEQLPGTYSYKYIEISLRNGALEDLEQHAVGPPEGISRPAGSTIRPFKSSRTEFTPEDDRILVNWVLSMEKNNEATMGNEIYKQLEAKNPRHTWQSWRNRWVKTLKNLPRSAHISQDAPPTPPAEQSGESKDPTKLAAPLESRSTPFTKQDAEELLKNSEYILKIPPEKLDDAWSTLARSCENPEDHSAKDWQDFWEETIRPIYLKRKARSSGDPMEPQGDVRTEAITEEISMQQQSTMLPVRVSPAKKPVTKRHLSRSPSYHPESPTQYSETAKADKASVASVAESVDGASDSRFVSVPPSKRKRPASEDIEEVQEVPSSSPPEKVRYPKRHRHGDVNTPPGRLGSSPQPEPVGRIAREVPDTYAVDVPGKATATDLVDLLEEDEEPSQASDEDDYDPEKAHSVSPELGRSPPKPFTNIQRTTSETQAALDDPLPPIDFDLALPEGGFGDEDEDEDEDADPEFERNGRQEHGSQETELFHSLEADEQVGTPAKTQPLSSEPEPESEADSDSGLFIQSSPPQARPASNKYNQSTTQALLAAETQEPDYSLPDPEGGWDPAYLPSSQPEWPPSSPPDLPVLPLAPKQQHPLNPPPPPPAPTNNRSPSPDPAAQVDAFIDEHLARGHTEAAIHVALKSTNMDPALSVTVLGIMKRDGGQVPRGLKGCWTDEDDRDLGSVDARRIRGVEEKHGKGAVEERWAFLEECRR